LDKLNARRKQILALFSGKLIFFIGAGGEEVCIKTSVGFKVFEKLNPSYQFNQLSVVILTIIGQPGIIPHKFELVLYLME